MVIIDLRVFLSDRVLTTRPLKNISHPVNRISMSFFCRNAGA